MGELKLVYERASSRRGTRLSTSVAAALLVLSTLSVTLYGIGFFWCEPGDSLPEWLVGSFILAWPASGVAAVVALVAVVRGDRGKVVWTLLGIGLAEFIGITIWWFSLAWIVVAGT